MAQRKQTPNVLDEILGSGQPGAAEVLPGMPRPAPVAVKPLDKPATKKATRSKPTQSTFRQPTTTLNWRYQTASFQDYKGWRLRFVEGVEIPNWSNSPLLHEYIQQMAAQGWELVSSSAGERLYGLNDKHQLFFRHPE